VGQEKGALMITNSNHAYFAKVLGREVQEEVLKEGVAGFTYLSSVTS
jgi:hypothetical protein